MTFSINFAKQMSKRSHESDEKVDVTFALIAIMRTHLKIIFVLALLCICIRLF